MSESPEEDWDQTLETATMLEEELGIDSKCWVNAVAGPVPLEDASKTGVLMKRPNDISYPIMVTSLPLSGTQEAEKYFKCGLGQRAVASQFILKSRRVEEDIPIGECVMLNLRNHKPIFAGCGESTTKVYNDIGTICRKGKTRKKPICYYPTLHGGLEAFAKSYPRGTLVHFVAAEFKDWFKVSFRPGMYVHLPNLANASLTNIFCYY